MFDHLFTAADTLSLWLEASTSLPGPVLALALAGLEVY